MVKRNLLIGGKVFFGLLTLGALGKQLGIHLEAGYNPVNFFSYFTNLSNIFAAVVLLVGAGLLAVGHKPAAKFDVIRGTSVVCMAIVGVVFSVLLRDVDLGTLLPWINVVIHYVMPVVVVADWFYQPPASKLIARYIGYWLIFPAGYLAYSLIRGAITGWYAYPFLNPDETGGYAGVAAYALGILGGFLGFSWLLIRSAHQKVRRR